MTTERLRRDLLALTVIFMFLLSTPVRAVAGSAPRRVLVVISGGGEAYAEAAEGLRSVLKDCSIETVDLSDPASSQLLEAKLNESGLDATVSVGTAALLAVTARPSAVPLISTMVLRGEADRAAPPLAGRRTVAAVTLDVSLGQLLAKLQRVMPGRARLGIIRNSGRPGPALSLLRAEAKQAGFSLDVRECSRADELLKVFLSFRNQVDFVWCPPDGSLFNSATVKALVLASVRSGLPIVGFSENFVRAGAAVGIYPDYEDVGRQTGDLVRRIVEGRSSALASELPESLRVAVNQRILRVLGVHLKPPELHDNRFLILR